MRECLHRERNQKHGGPPAGYIQYDLFKPTAWDFMHWYYHRAMRLVQPQLPDEAEVLFLVELAVMHLKMWQFKPSMLVAVCIIALDEVHLRWTGQHLLTGYHYWT